jgi:hypothetical protein
MMHVQPPRMAPAGVHVLSSRFLDPAVERVELTMAEGLTVAEIVAVVLPGLPATEYGHCRVALTDARGSVILGQERWHRIRPKPGVTVTVRLAPGKNALQTVLQIAVSIAAIALGQFWLGPLISGSLGFAAGGLAAQAVGLAVTGVLQLGGAFLIGALFGGRRDDRSEKPTFVISGWQNEFTPDAPVPNLMGKLRIAPKLLMSWTEVVGDEIWFNALFTAGYGPVAHYDAKIGDTPVTEFDELDIVWREGWEADDPIRECRRSIFEDRFNGPVELTRDFIRDDNGEVAEPKEAPEKEVVRIAATDADELSVIIAFPGGLMRFNDEGDERSLAVGIRIRCRLVGTDEWELVDTLNIRAKKREAIYRQFSWKPAVRGLYEVGLTRMSEERTESKYIDRCAWYALQSIRPEYPLNFPHPLQLAFARAKGTHQLQGGLERFNFVGSRIALDWDSGAEEWVMRETQSPAAAARLFLQGPSNDFPVADSGIDLEDYQELAEFDALKGLSYNRMHDFEADVLQNLFAALAAGRANPRHDGVRHRVIIDRPQDITVDHLTPSNSRDFGIERTYFTQPDAFISKFNDETDNYQPRARLVLRPADIRRETLPELEAVPVVEGLRAEVWNDPLVDNIGPWIGKGGRWEKNPIRITELLDQPGVTNPRQIWLGGRRRFHELELRPDTIRLTQDGAVRVATRGDQVVGAWAQLVDGTQEGFWVKSARGDLIELDRPVEMQAGKSYACRWQDYSEEDTVGDGVLRAVATLPGKTGAIRLTGNPDKQPAPGTLLIFGEAGQESMALRVRATEPGDEMSTIFHLVAAAPEIDEKTDADALCVPAWDGRVGEIAALGDFATRLTDDDGHPLVDDDGYRLVDDEDLPAPAAPVIVGISTDGAPPEVAVQLRPGAGSAPVASYRAEHRLAGGGAWAADTGTAAEGVVRIDGYAVGDDIELTVQALDAEGEAGDFGPTVAYRVGADMRFLPEIETFEVTRLGTMWRYEWTVTALEEWQQAATILGAELRFRAGAWGDWEDLQPVLSELATTSPWDSSSPIGDGLYTFGIRLAALGGLFSEPVLIYAIAPPADIVLLTDDDGFVLADDDNYFIQEDA